MNYIELVTSELSRIRDANTFKHETPLESAQAGVVIVKGKPVVMMASNNYLGMSNHPVVRKAAIEGIRNYGYGVASVRFICGTQTIHKELEARLSAFLRTEDTILYSSCFDANTGLFETLLGEEDAIISDELNHASIIDGVRLCKAKRWRYKNNDMADLERCLKEAAGARFRMIATDGVFSMDGILANLPAICDLAEKYEEAFEVIRRGDAFKVLLKP